MLSFRRAITFIKNEKTPMKAFAMLAGGALCFGMVSASADKPDMRTPSRFAGETPLIIGHATLMGAAPAIEIEVSSFPGVEASDPLIDIGSLTKFVTAVTVLKLIDQGAFTLQSPISDLLDGVPEDKQDITVHAISSPIQAA